MTGGPRPSAREAERKRKQIKKKRSGPITSRVKGRGKEKVNGPADEKNGPSARDQAGGQVEKEKKERKRDKEKEKNIFNIQNLK
jgi:hypothetical protein